MADEEMDQLAALRGLADRDAAYALATAQVPLRRPADPAEVAAVVAFLASGHASAVTGEQIHANAAVVAVAPQRGSRNFRLPSAGSPSRDRGAGGTHRAPRSSHEMGPQEAYPGFRSPVTTNRADGNSTAIRRLYFQT